MVTCTESQLTQKAHIENAPEIVKFAGRIVSLRQKLVELDQFLRDVLFLHCRFELWQARRILHTNNANLVK